MKKGLKYYDYSQNHADKINHKINETDIELNELDNYPEIKTAYEKQCKIENAERKIRKANELLDRTFKRAFYDDYEAQDRNNHKWRLLLNRAIKKYNADKISNTKGDTK
jgi:hypothetical protein